MTTEGCSATDDLGVFYIEIGEITGFQGLSHANTEHLIFHNVAFGLGFGASVVDVEADTDDWEGAVDLDIFDARIFVRFRL